jgi:hypothetical protein
VSQDAGIAAERPLASLSRDEALRYLAAARRELSEDHWLRSRLGSA